MKFLRFQFTFLPLFMAGLLLLGVVGIGLSSGCTTLNPVTGLHEYDPIKTEQVKAAVEPLVSGGVYRVIVNSPDHSDQIATYFRSIGSVFLKMKTTGVFTPEYLVVEVEKATVGLQSGLPALALDSKNALLAIYRIFWAERFNAELSPEKWPIHLADVMSTSIDTALKDAGKAGL